LAFQRYSQIRGRSWGFQEICNNVTVNTCKIHVPLHAAVVRCYKCNVMTVSVWLPV